jgi:hypothetical protein
VTAVFAANDDMAIGLIRALTEAGRRVPEDVSVVGFDDIPVAAYVTPPADHRAAAVRRWRRRVSSCWCTPSRSRTRTSCPRATHRSTSSSAPRPRPRSPGRPREPVSQADIDKAMKTPTELTFWTWVPNIDKEVALFEKKYPAIKVKVVNAGQGTAAVHQAAHRAEGRQRRPGHGADRVPVHPDLHHHQQPARPAPVRRLGAQGQVRRLDLGPGQRPNGEIWAIPQDTGPMGMLYRQGHLRQARHHVPKTWDEFAAAARKLHKADPNVYLTNLAANQPPPGTA